MQAFTRDSLLEASNLTVSISGLLHKSYLAKKFINLDFNNNPHKLSGKIYNVHEELLKIVNNKKSISTISKWIVAFAEVDSNYVYNALYLPPFEDVTLRKGDVLVVSAIRLYSLTTALSSLYI